MRKTFGALVATLAMMTAAFAAPRSVAPPYAGDDSTTRVCDFRSVLTDCAADALADASAGTMSSEISLSSWLDLPGMGWGETISRLDLTDQIVSPVQTVRYTIHVRLISAQVESSITFGSAQATISFGGIALHNSCSRCVGLDGQGRILASDFNPGPHGPTDFDLVINLAHRDGGTIPAGTVTLSLTMQNDLMFSLAAGDARSSASMAITSFDAVEA